MFTIAPLSTKNQSTIERKINHKTKPIGSLGQLEAIATQLALILGHQQPQLSLPTQLVFAGDHGVSHLGISIAGPEVTGQMVANFCQGGAAINAFCTQNNMTLKIIDCGTVNEQKKHSRLIKQRLGDRTQPFHTHDAMSQEQLSQGLALGATVALETINTGVNIIGIGEMGIGNTTSAAAIMHAITGHDISFCVGKGTGVDNKTMALKKDIITQAIITHQESLRDPSEVLRLLGGFEIVQMVGAMLAIAKAGKVIIVDGFISSAAALIACTLAPNARDYMLFSHCSNELGHKLLLKELGGEAILNLDLRLGEGTGCPLALPLIHSALAFYNNMANFEQTDIHVDTNL